MNTFFTWLNKFFSGLFNNRQQPVPKTQDMVNTAPLSEQQIQAILSNNNPRYELQQLIAGCGQSVGKQRELNEDSLLAITAMMAGNVGNLPFGLYIPLSRPPRPPAPGCRRTCPRPSSRSSRSSAQKFRQLETSCHERSQK